MERREREANRLAAQQSLRIRRTLLGLTGYAVAYLVLISVYLVDRMAISGTALAVAIGLSLCTNAVFLGLIASGANLRFFRDPSLTFWQVLIGLLWMLWAVWSAPDARGLMTLLIIPPFMFGLFRLNTPAQLGLTGFVSLGYGLIMLDQSLKTDDSLVLAATYWMTVTLMLGWLSMIGGHVSRLRQRLHERNRELEITRDRMAELAVTDDLTGLANRRHMGEIMKRERARALRQGRTFSLAVLDLDHFKQVNDNYGHLVGDEVLSAFSERIQALLRDSDWVGQNSDTIGRVGGEEFILLLPDTDAEQARQCAERICQAIAEEPFRVREGSIRVTVSIGVASFRPDESLDSLHSRADHYLYLAKSQGRNRLVADPA